MAVTLQDHSIRLQQFTCCIATKGNDLVKKLRLGISCEKDILILELLVGYYDTLLCFDPTVTDNCLTQEQVDTIWDAVADCCGVCFLPYGTNYTQIYAQQNQNISGNRITAAGDRRLTTEDDLRAIK